jgi:hypothetical protein
VEAVISSLVSTRGLRGTTLANRTARMRWFTSFVEALGVPDLDAVTPGQVLSFVHSRRASGQKPTLSERHSRLAAVRLLYREARALGLTSSDPTLDIELALRRPTSARALPDEGIELGRMRAVRNSAYRPAVCWALAEAGAWTSEMPNIRVSDLEPPAGTVYLHGGATTDPRLARLTPWGLAQLRRRCGSIEEREGHDPILMGEGRWSRPDDGRAAATMAITTVLKSAGLSAPGINPRSIPAWAGAKALEDGASIDAVARMLGLRSLDQAAAIVGFDWRENGP